MLYYLIKIVARIKGFHQNGRLTIAVVNIFVKISTLGNFFTFDTHFWSSILVTCRYIHL